MRCSSCSHARLAKTAFHFWCISFSHLLVTARNVVWMWSLAGNYLTSASQVPGDWFLSLILHCHKWLYCSEDIAERRLDHACFMMCPGRKDATDSAYRGSRTQTCLSCSLPRTSGRGLSTCWTNAYLRELCRDDRRSDRDVQSKRW